MFITEPNMWKILFMVPAYIVIFVLIYASASTDVEEPIVSPIVGGQYSEYLPWFVSITAQDYFCGGSVIAPLVVLTAAHCFQNYTTVDDMYVWYGTKELHYRDQIQIKSVFIHPNETVDYDGWRHNDIALVFVEKPLEDVVSWLWHHLCPGTTVWAAGFGGIIAVNRTHPNYTQVPSKLLKKTSLEVVDPDACTTAYGNVVDYDYEICTLSPGTGQCQGDSGGPIYGFDRHKNYVLFGIISFGFGCADDEYPHLAMRIWPHFDWIYDTIRFKFQMSGVYRGS